MADSVIVNGAAPSNGASARRLPLSDYHLADLRKSGLSDETIRLCCFETIDSKEASALLNWDKPTSALGKCLKIPFLDREGKTTDFARIKPSKPRTRKEEGEKKEVKYEQPKGRPIRPYFPPMAWTLIDDPAPSLLITEGEKKAVKAAQEGFACIGLTGVDCWSAPRERDEDGKPIGPRHLHPDLAALALSGRNVFIVFDSDLSVKPDVQRAERSLALALTTAGAKVRCARLPSGDNGEKIGLDDYLCRYTADELRNLLATAEAIDTTQPPKRRRGKPPSPDSPARQDARTEVEICADEHEVVQIVAAILSSDDQLFQRDGRLVRPLTIRDTDPGANAEPGPRSDKRLRIEYPTGSIVLRPAESAFVRLRITAHCVLMGTDRKGNPKQVNPPAWLAPAVDAAPGNIRPIAGVLPGPTLDHTGRLINTVGYDAPTRFFMGRACPALAMPDFPSLDDARGAAEVLTELVEDFPFADPEQRGELSRWLCLLLAACCRHLIDRTPLGLITANQAGSGKTFLARLISIIAHGTRFPILMSWPEGSELMARGDEIRKRLASLLTESASLVLLDNLPRGEDFGSPEVDAFLTSDAYHDRQLGKNDGSRVGGVNRCLLLATGNNVMPSGDTADRTLLLRLWTADPNPRSRPSEAFHRPDLERYALDERPRYLAAALTIWRARILAGTPRPEGPAWGSFECFVDTVVSIIRWLGWPDPIGDRTKHLDELDREGQALRGVLALWESVLGTEPLRGNEILAKIEAAGGSDAGNAFREFLQTLGRIGKWPPTLQRLGKSIASHRGRVAEVESPDGSRVRLVLRSDYCSNTKANRYFVERLPSTGAGRCGECGECGESSVPPRGRAGASAPAGTPSERPGTNPAFPAHPATDHKGALVEEITL